MITTVTKTHDKVLPLATLSLTKIADSPPVYFASIVTGPILLSHIPFLLPDPP